MALHRDIFWVGRQWAVTGYGIQAVDQKHKGQFDIEIGRLWEDGLAESLQADGWLNSEDFGKAHAAARGRFPEPPRMAAEVSAGAPVEPTGEPSKPVELPNELRELLKELARPVERSASPVEPSRKTLPPEVPRQIADLKAGAPIGPLIEPPKPAELPVEPPTELAKPAEPPTPPVEAPSPVAQTFDNMRIVGWPAKFLRPWRARVLR